MSLKKAKKSALHLVHASVNPTNLLNKDFDQKVAKDAQSGFGVLNDHQAQIAGQIAPIVTAFIPGIGPLISAGITAANNFANTGKVGSSLLKGGLSYAGNKFGSDIFGDLGTVGGAADKLGLGDLASMAGNTISGGSISNALGGLAGNAIADSAAPYLDGAPDTTNFQAYRPKQEGEGELPSSLQGFGGLDPMQQQTNIANKGVYGGGLGEDENKYFLNLVNRQLVDKSGSVQGQQSLSPITSSYLQQLGLGGYGNSNDLLQAISNWHS